MSSAELLSAGTSGDSPQRLAAVRRYAVLDAPADGAFIRVCALAARFFDVPFASVTIVDDEQIWIKAAEGLDAPHIRRSAGLCASAILQDEPYVVSDGLSDPRTEGNELVHGEFGARFYAAAPIVTRDGYRLGTVNVLDTKPREASPRETRTLCDLAAIVMNDLDLRLAAMGEVKRQQTMREEAEHIAGTLRRSLSPPSLPRIAGLDSAVHYEPFDGGDIGGDFYDVYPLGVGRTGFFLGDVCGKGLEAATITSLARYTMRTAAMLTDGPVAILANLNDVLLLEPADSMKPCTVVCGEIHITPAGAAVTLAAAGHPPPFVVRADGTVEPTTPHGTILGAVGDPEFHACTIHLDQGDAIVIFSDGVLDTVIDGVPLDEQRTAELLSGPPIVDAQTLVDRITGSIPGSARRRDDIAVLSLRLTEPASSQVV